MAFDIKFKEKNNFEKKSNKEINICLSEHVESKYDKSINSDSFNNSELPKEGHHIYFITTKRRNADIFIDAISPDNLLLINSRLKKSDILDKIENKIIVVNYSKDYDIIEVRNHSKVIVADNYVILGSGNVSVNARIEKYIIFNNKDLAEKIKDEFDKKKNSLFSPKIAKQIKINLPQQNKIQFYYQNRNLCPLYVINEIEKVEQIKYIEITGFRINKKSIFYLDKFNTSYFFSDSMKYMVQDVFKMLYERNCTFNNYHQKTVLVRTENNYYTITSSNNIDTEDNLDYLAIENNKQVFNDLLKCQEEKEI